jgi:hypothetical protein
VGAAKLLKPTACAVEVGDIALQSFVGQTMRWQDACQITIQL